jgi:hypothetical protein
MRSTFGSNELDASCKVMGSYIELVGESGIE